MLTDWQKASLLRVARASVSARVLGRHASGAAAAGRAADGIETFDASGVFVTIKKQGELRGCLGTLEIRLGLVEEVVRCAAQSASEDPRFPAVSADELPLLTLELSVLGPLEPIAPSPAAFTVGVHGLVVAHGERRGLLLPQVAVEWGWTPEEFLHHTCMKARLPGDAWRRGAEIFRFAAEVFGD